MLYAEYKSDDHLKLFLALIYTPDIMKILPKNKLLFLLAVTKTLFC